MKISLGDRAGQPTSHGCGIKKVLLCGDETDTALTQIAVTSLKADVIVESHVHPTMEECFLVRTGSIRMTVGDTIIELNEDDFIRIPCNTLHGIEVLSDCEILTIGCAVE